MFKIGDYAFDSKNNDRVQIIDMDMVWGFVSYKVFNPNTGKVYKLPADALSLETSNINSNEYYLRYVAMQKSKVKLLKAFYQSFLTV